MSVFSFSRKAGIVALFLVLGTHVAAAQGAAAGGALTGGVCKAVALVTRLIAKGPGPVNTEQTEQTRKAEMAAWSEVLAGTMIPLEEFDSAVASPDIAAVMANVSAQAQADVDKDNKTGERNWTAFDIARTSFAVVGVADPIGVTSITAAYLYPKCSTDEAKTGRGTFCWKDSQVRSVGIIPKGCDAANPEYQDGLCYATCPAGMKGQGPVCWTDTKVSAPRGVGVVPSACPSTHPDQQAGLCYKSCPEGYGGVGPVCWKGIKSQPRGVGVPLNACDSKHPQFDAGLCYAACPEGYQGVGPVCWTQKKVSQPRGAGVIPTGCPADRPNLDAGLCYPACSSGTGVGPVCWTACTGRFSEACGAGCAENKLECGFATTDMVASPLEMVANIVTLGTASANTAGLRVGRKVAREAAEKAAKEAAEQAAKEAAERAVKEAAEKAAKETVEKAAKEAAEKAALKKYFQQIGKEWGFDDSFADDLVKLSDDAPGVSEAAGKSVLDRMKNGYALAKAKGERTIFYLKSDGGTQIIETLDSGWIKLKTKGGQLATNTPQAIAQRKLANKLAQKERSQKILKKLEAAYDKTHMQEIAAAESFITGCAKFGLAVSKAALGVPETKQ